MNSYSGYKLKPKEYSIQPNDIIIRVIPGAVAVPTGTIAIALEDSCVALAPHQCWPEDFTDWRAIETRLGQKAVAGDTVYCIRNTRGSCKQHDSFVVNKYYSESDSISPIVGHKLLNSTITEENWSWSANNFVVLVKADSKEIQEFPCFRISIKNGHVVEFVSPKEGTVVISGKSDYPLKYTSNTWVAYTDTSVWEPCEAPAISHIPVDPFEAKPGDYVEWADESTDSSSMTKGQLYKVVKVRPNMLTILNNLNRENTWLKESFKRVLKLDSHKPFTDLPSSNLRGSFDIDFDDTIIPPSLATLAIDTADYIMNKPTQTKPNSKGKQMNSNLFTDILKLLMQTEQTDLEKAPSTYAFFYNNEGEYEGTARVANEAEAKALLQKPEHLGYTMRIYSFSDEFTTQIPVVSTIKKTVVAKPDRKPRATKA